MHLMKNLLLDCDLKNYFLQVRSTAAKMLPNELQRQPCCCSLGQWYSAHFSSYLLIYLEKKVVNLQLIYKIAEIQLLYDKQVLINKVNFNIFGSI